jgi:hypothetical protein
MRRATPKNESSRGAHLNAVIALPSGEPLSPELVLVLPAELRSQVLADLPLPAWPKPRPAVRPAPPPDAEPVARPVARLVLARFAQLALIFVGVTILTLAMSLVAQAVR